MINGTIKPINHILDGQLTGEFKVAGWVKTRRDSKAGISFIQLNDGSSMQSLQIVVGSSLPNYESDVLALTTGCSIIAVGQVVASQGKDQSVEMQASSIEVVGWVDDPASYPMQPKRHTLEFLREFLHLRPRTNTIAAASRIRSIVSQAIHDFMHQEGFFWIHTPIITGSDCEGAGEMFRVTTLNTKQAHKDFAEDFFARETFLTVSGQLNVEAYCMALSKVYTFGPTFRAENSNTSRHLAEFWMVEPELAFADLQDVALLAQRMLRYVFKVVLEKSSADLEFFNQYIDPECIARITNLVNAEFETVTYTDAIELLKKSGQKFVYPVDWGLDLQSEHERYLSEQLFKKPVIIINYPKQIKSFYMRANEDGKTVAAMDILVPGIGEIIGGSQREERYDVLLARMEELGMPIEPYKWYLDTRRYGTVPHGGFGLGLERLISYITGLSNVRDVIPFPRTPGNAEY